MGFLNWGLQGDAWGSVDMFIFLLIFNYIAYSVVALLKLIWILNTFNTIWFYIIVSFSFSKEIINIKNFKTNSDY